MTSPREHAEALVEHAIRRSNVPARPPLLGRHWMLVAPDDGSHNAIALFNRHDDEFGTQARRLLADLIMQHHQRCTGQTATDLVARLHECLDRLGAWYLGETGKLISETSVMQLLQWADEKIKTDGRV